MSIFSLLLGPLETVLERVIPDVNQRKKAKEELLKAEQNGEFNLAIKQIEVNLHEAKHKNLFVAGWRPFIGWVCGTAFAYHFVALPITKVVSAYFGQEIPEVAFDMTTLTTVLMGMLGLGGLRTFEKFKGVNKR